MRQLHARSHGARRRRLQGRVRDAAGPGRRQHADRAAQWQRDHPVGLVHAGRRGLRFGRRAQAGHAGPLPGAGQHRAGRSRRAADPVPGQPARRMEPQGLAVRWRRLQRRAGDGPGAAARRRARRSPAARARLCHAGHRLGPPGERLCRQQHRAVRTERRNARQLRLCRLQEDARRGAGHHAALLRPGARQVLLLRRLRGRARGPDHGTAFPDGLRRHRERRARGAVVDAVPVVHPAHRAAVRRRLDERGEDPHLGEIRLGQVRRARRHRRRRGQQLPRVPGAHPAAGPALQRRFGHRRWLPLGRADRHGPVGAQPL